GAFADVLTLQDQIAEQATRALALKLDSDERQSIRRHYTGNSEAYQQYIMGRSYCSAGNGKSLEKGIAHFQEATVKDPRFALAHASLATCYAQLVLHPQNQTSRMEVLTKLKAAAQRAAEIDGSLPEAYLPLAMAKAYYDWDLPGAEAALRKSI